MELQTEETRGEIGFEPGATPEEFLDNMLAHLREAAARLENPPPDRAPPPVLRWRAAFQEAVTIEQEVAKGEAGNATVLARADLLRADVWDRWRASEGLAPVTGAPLTDAIKANAEKLAAANGLRIDYVRKKNFRKEDRVEASAVAHRTQ